MNNEQETLSNKDIIEAFEKSLNVVIREENLFDGEYEVVTFLYGELVEMGILNEDDFPSFSSDDEVTTHQYARVVGEDDHVYTIVADGMNKNILAALKTSMIDGSVKVKEIY